MGLRASSRRPFFLVAGTLAFSGFPVASQAQQVSVTGVVVERTQGSWIGGATVRLSGSPPYFTNLDGAFRFSGVTPGRHTLSVQALGYQARSLELDIRSDTTLTIELDPDPIVLDSLLVRSRSGAIKIMGDVRDAETGRKVPHAYVSVQPGLQTADLVDGFFILRKVPIGQALTVLIEAVEYLPARIALITDADTTLTIELEPDPVGIRLLAEQVWKLETRSNSLPLSRSVIDREDLVHNRGGTAYDIVEARLRTVRHTSNPFGMTGGGTRPQCIFIDDIRQLDVGFLWGLWAGEVERVEIYGRGAMVRVYTKRFVIGLGVKDLPSIGYMNVGLMGPVCW